MSSLFPAPPLAAQPALISLFGSLPSMNELLSVTKGKTKKKSPIHQPQHSTLPSSQPAIPRNSVKIPPESLGYIHAIPFQLNYKHGSSPHDLVQHQCSPEIPPQVPKSLFLTTIPSFGNKESRRASSSSASSASSDSSSLSPASSSASSSSFSSSSPSLYVPSPSSSWSSSPLSTPNLLLPSSPDVPDPLSLSGSLFERTMPANVSSADRPAPQSLRLHDPHRFHSTAMTSAGSVPVFGNLPRKYGKRSRHSVAAPAQPPNNRQKTVLPAPAVSIVQQKQNDVDQAQPQQLQLLQLQQQLQQQQQIDASSSVLDFGDWILGIASEPGILNSFGNNSSTEGSHLFGNSLLFDEDRPDFDYSLGSPFQNFDPGTGTLFTPDPSIFTEGEEENLRFWLEPAL